MGLTWASNEPLDHEENRLSRGRPAVVLELPFRPFNLVFEGVATVTVSPNRTCIAVPPRFAHACAGATVVTVKRVCANFTSRATFFGFGFGDQQKSRLTLSDADRPVLPDRKRASELLCLYFRRLFKGYARFFSGGEVRQS
eukprot:1076439-Rhodomonas_salina.5